MHFLLGLYFIYITFAAITKHTLIITIKNNKANKLSVLKENILTTGVEYGTQLWKHSCFINL